MADKTVEEKLDAIFDSISKRMDATDARLDATCARMDSEKQEAEAKAKKDAEDEKAKKDAAEKEETEAKAKKDAEEAEAKAKKDADEKKEADEKAAKDAAASHTDVRKLIADMEKRLPANMTAADVTKYTAAQRRAERVYQAFGDAAGADRWANGETFDSYRRRLLAKVKTHSTQWKDVDLSAFADAALDVVETQVYADAYSVAISPASVPAGTLREHVTTDDTGRKIKSYTGDPGACWDAFKAAPRHIGGITVKFPH